MSTTSTSNVLFSATEAEEAPGYVSGMERLITAVRDLAGARHIDAVVEIVRHAARELVDADGATFVLRDEGMCFYVDEDAIAPLWSGSRFPLDACISGWAMLNASQVAIPDIYLDDRIPHDAYRPTFVKSLAMTPVRATDPIAAIGTYWADPHQPTHMELRLIQALADSTAVALENVRVQSGLEQLVEERTAELARANSDLEQFASITAHDLRSPLVTLRGLAGVLTQELGETGSAVGAAVDAITRTTTRLSGLVDDLLTFATTGTAKLAASPVDLDSTVPALLEELAHFVVERDAVIEVGELGVISADWALLHQAIQNLVVNAVTYVESGVRPRVRIAVDRSAASVAVTVTDNGPGVPVAERQKILQPYERGEASAGEPGSGLGLAICHRVAQHHGGTLEIRDGRSGGTEFSLVLPTG